FARIQAEPGQPIILFVVQIVLEPAPAFLAETHVAAAGVEQQFDFLFGESGVRDVEHDAKIKPINGSFGDIELDATGDSFIGERGEFSFKLDMDVGWEADHPGTEDFGEFFGDSKGKTVAEDRLEIERFQERGDL